MHDVDTVVSAVHGFIGSRGISPQLSTLTATPTSSTPPPPAAPSIVMVSVVGAAADSSMELFRMKHAAEQHAFASGMPTTIVRATAFLELWIELLCQTAERSGRPVVFGRGDNAINFVSVTDVAALVDFALTDPSTRSAVFEIAGPDNLTFNQLTRAVQNADGRTGGPRHMPPAMLRLLAATAGRIKPQLGRQTRAALAMDRDDLTADAHSLRQRYPDLPCTSISDVLAASRRHAVERSPGR